MAPFMSAVASSILTVEGKSQYQHSIHGRSLQAWDKPAIKRLHEDLSTF